MRSADGSNRSVERYRGVLLRRNRYNARGRPSAVTDGGGHHPPGRRGVPAGHRARAPPGSMPGPASASRWASGTSSRSGVARSRRPSSAGPRPRTRAEGPRPRRGRRSAQRRREHRGPGPGPADRLLRSPTRSPSPRSTPARPRWTSGRGSSGSSRKALAGRPFVRGDVFVIPGVFLMGGSLPFMVVSTAPKGTIQVGPTTLITIKDETVTETEVAAPRVSYEDIGGLKEKLGRVREMIELPLKHPGALRPPRDLPAEGSAVVRPARDREDPDRQGGRQRGGGPLPRDPGPRDHLQVLRGEREGAAGEVRGGGEERPLGDLHRRARLHRPPAGRGRRRGGAPGRRPAPHPDGRPLGSRERHRDRGDQPGGGDRSRAARPGRLRPGDRDRRPDPGGRLEILQIHTRGMPIEGTDKERERTLEGARHVEPRFRRRRPGRARPRGRHAGATTLPPGDRLRQADPPHPARADEGHRAGLQGGAQADRAFQPAGRHDRDPHDPLERDRRPGAGQAARSRSPWNCRSRTPGSTRHMGIEPPAGDPPVRAPWRRKDPPRQGRRHGEPGELHLRQGPGGHVRSGSGSPRRPSGSSSRRPDRPRPAIVFIDEIDSIAPRRGMQTSSGVTERIVNQLLTSIDGLESLERVLVLAATNRPDILDEALLRTGRFDRLVYVEPPNVAGRLEILKVHTRRMPLDGRQPAGSGAADRSVRRQRPRRALPRSRPRQPSGRTPRRPR